MAMRRAATIGLILVAGIALAGCTGEPSGSPSGPASGSPSPSASTPAPTTTGDAADADEALLPIPADEIRDWAETAVPGAGAEGSSPILSGWLSENTSPHQKTFLQSQEAGAYQAQLACRGDGTITLRAGELDEEQPSAEPIVCDDETIAFDVTTAATGMQIVMDLEGAPTIYALSLQRMS
ncbi:hypothetical protein [Microbacterium sp. NPDC097977]|uniref:hypothetical protein n=1 Tax=Microbacterium sp. NPDC097977 TaxID=3155686 RepID=UPI0033207258